MDENSKIVFLKAVSERKEDLFGQFLSKLESPLNPPVSGIDGMWICRDTSHNPKILIQRYRAQIWYITKLLPFSLQNFRNLGSIKAYFFLLQYSSKNLRLLEGQRSRFVIFHVSGATDETHFLNPQFTLKPLILLKS